MRAAIAILAGLFLTISTTEFATAGGWGVGTWSCTDFTKFYAANPTKAELVFLSWSQGFISGLELSIESNGGALIPAGAQFPEEAFKTQINEYCALHPSDPYLQAVLTFYVSLPDRLKMRGR